MIAEPARPRHAEARDEVRILAERAFPPAPPLVAGDVQDRRVDVGVADRARLVRHRRRHAVDEVGVPGRSDRVGRREARGMPRAQAPDALIGEVRRNPEPRLLHEEPLQGDQQPCVQLGRRRLRDRLRVRVLIDVRDAVLPDLLLPLVGRKDVSGVLLVAVERREPGTSSRRASSGRRGLRCACRAAPLDPRRRPSGRSC